MIPRLLHVALAVAVFLSSSLPCGFGPSGAEGTAPATQAAAPDAHAHSPDASSAMASGDAAVPCHGPPPELPPELTLPCTCGCDQRAAGGSAGLSQLPVAVLMPELEPATPSRAPVPPLPDFDEAPGFPSPPDVVPWA